MHLEKYIHVEGTCRAIENKRGGEGGREKRQDKDLAETQDSWSHLLVAALAGERECVSRQQ